MFNIKNIEPFKTCIIVVTSLGLTFSGIMYSKTLQFNKEVTEYNKKIEKTLKDMSDTLETMEKEVEAKEKAIEDLEKKLEENVNTIEEKQKDLEKKNIELDKKVSSKELARKNELLASQSKKENTVKTVSVTKPTNSNNENTGNKNVSESNNNQGGTAITMSLSYYGELSGVCADGSKVAYGVVASNVYPMGTKFLINGEVFTVRDRGGKHFNSYNRLDVFIPRKSGESNSDYKARLYQLGRRTVTVYKLN